MEFISVAVVAITIAILTIGPVVAPIAIRRERGRDHEWCIFFISVRVIAGSSSSSSSIAVATTMMQHHHLHAVRCAAIATSLGAFRSTSHHNDLEITNDSSISINSSLRS